MSARSGRTVGATITAVVPLAPRYDLRIVDAVRALDDRSVPIAEVSRRIGAFAEAIGVPRPAYVHLRRLIHAHRIRQDAIRELAGEVAADVVARRTPNPYWVIGRIQDLPPGPSRKS